MVTKQTVAADVASSDVSSSSNSKERRRRRREKLSRKRNNTSEQRRFFSIRNFRPVAGLETPTAKIYRCGSTDVLGSRIRHNNNRDSTTTRRRKVVSSSLLLLQSERPSEADTLVQRDAGLIIDLRSAPERREDDASLWMNESLSSTFQDDTGKDSARYRPIRVLTIPLGGNNNNNNNNTVINTIFGETDVKNLRYVFRLDVLNRSELLAYARKQWLQEIPWQESSSPKANQNHNHNHNYNRIMTELNRRGLAGLNEAILETPTGQKGMCVALKLVTLYREAVARASDRNQQIAAAGVDGNRASIVFHCVQGKDRTGMLAMLMQLLVGCSDEIIVDDYYRSNAEFVTSSSSSSVSTNQHESVSAAASAIQNGDKKEIATSGSMTTTSRVRMDASVFRGTNRAAMVSTLEGLRTRYGQSLDGYFDAIGFDSAWRKRFLVAVFGTATTTTRNPCSRL